MRQAGFAKRKNEHGVSLLIVALALVALIAMAALSIDVASLYTARGEAQRAANAAALAGAKIFVTSSYTSAASAWSDTSALCVTSGPGSIAAANKQAEAVAASNLIAGRPGQVQSINCDLSRAGNPQITVTTLQTGVPTFFAKIWGAAVTTVTATATAEAYNVSGHSLPVALTNVKPWLIPNCNPFASSPGPCAGGYFIDPATGNINPNDFVGKQMQLNRTLSGVPGGTGTAGAAAMTFYGLNFPDTPAPVCPSPSAVSCGPPVNTGDPYIDNIACASRLPIRCGEPIGNGQPITAAGTDVTGTPTSEGGRCLIHADDDGLDEGQDSFSTGVPVTITGGANNPDPSLRGTDNISRSDSVVTLPIDNGTQLCPGGTCTATTHVIGFLQVAVRNTTGGPQVPVVIVNAVGCSPGLVGGFPPGNPISAGGTSPILVRLIQP
jgi:Putative Flp pilus-assembly TadE/G-like